jgi:O-methyltransferase involved in polyketide biosynthesis
MDAEIEDVADTALWIAAYRAAETESPRALFRDPLAARLAGDKGRAIARKMRGAPQFAWMTVVRTVVIDDFLREAIAAGADTVVNIGAGLDTRPYRMELPDSLSWIEVDVPKIVALKDARLQGEAPRCRLQRLTADLAAAPFLNLAVRARRTGIEKNAPLKFETKDPAAFYAAHGWRLAEMRYLPDVGERVGRPVPWPIWFRPVKAVLPRRAQEALRTMLGYARLERA